MEGMNMNLNNLNKGICWILILQLSFGSFAYAKDEDGKKAEKPKKDWTQVAAQGAQMATSLASQFFNRQQSQQQMQQFQMQQQAEMKWLDPSNCGVQGGPYVPCFDDKFPQCKILKTKPNINEYSMCKEGIEPGDPNFDQKQQMIMTYINGYKQFSDMYENMSVAANKHVNTGLDCVSSEIEKINTELNNQMIEIDNLKNKIQDAQEKFKSNPNLIADEKKMRQSQALLKGEESGDINKLELSAASVNFETAFKSNDCNSVTSPEEFRSTGASKGLLGIESELLKKTSEKLDGGYSAIDFDQNLRSSMEKDIQKLAQNIADDFEVSDLDSKGNITTTSSVPSAFGLDSSPAFKASIGDSQAALSRDFKKIKDEASRYSSQAELVDDLFKENIDYNQKLNAFEFSQNNDCFSRSQITQMIQADPLLLRMEGASANANKFADSPFRTRILDILGNSQISLDQKLKNIQEAETSMGQNYRLRLQTSIVNENEVFKPGATSSITQVMKSLVTNCKQQFTNNPVSAGGPTGSELKTKLSGLRNKYTMTRNTAKSKIKNDIVKKMINCQDNYVGNAAATASCSSKNFSPKSDPTFCLNKAFSCASNMRSCLQKAQAKVKEVTKQRDDSAVRYRANVEKNKQDLSNMVNSTKEIIKRINDMNIPPQIKKGLFPLAGEVASFKINAPDMIPDLADLKIEDIDQYTKIAMTNLDGIKESIQKRNDMIMNGNGTGTGTKFQGLIGHLENLKTNHTNGKGKIDAEIAKCQDALDQARSAKKAADAAMAQKQAEEQGKVAEMCNRYNHLSNNPAPACEQAGTLYDDMVKVAAFAGNAQAMRNLGEFASYCNEAQSDETLSSGEFKKKYNSNISTPCNELRGEFKDEPACTEYKTKYDELDCSKTAQDTEQVNACQKIKEEAWSELLLLANKNNSKNQEKTYKAFIAANPDASALGQMLSACSAGNNSTGPTKSILDGILNMGKLLGEKNSDASSH